MTYNDISYFIPCHKNTLGQWRSQYTSWHWILKLVLHSSNLVLKYHLYTPTRKRTPHRWSVYFQITIMMGDNGLHDSSFFLLLSQLLCKCIDNSLRCYQLILFSADPFPFIFYRKCGFYCGAKNGHLSQPFLKSPHLLWSVTENQSF